VNFCEFLSLSVCLSVYCVSLCLKLGKEYIKDVYCHLVYLTYVQSTSCEMPD